MVNANNVNVNKVTVIKHRSQWRSV